MDVSHDTTRGRWKSQTQVNTTDGGADEFDGQVAALQDGGYIVVWTLAASPRLLTNAFGPTILGVALEAHPPSSLPLQMGAGGGSSANSSVGTRHPGLLRA
jgi:hypothetical protein